MDTSVILMGLGMLGICILPVILLSNKNKNNIQKIHKLLVKEAKKSGLEIQEYDVCPDLIIGTDTTGKQLLCLRKLKYDYEFKSVKLSDYAVCRMKENKRLAKHNNVETTIVDNIQFIFHSNDKLKSDLILVLYDSDTENTLTEEPQIAAKWLEKINAMMNK